MTRERENWGLYFHIPFCETRCGYCDFFSTAGYTREQIRHYFAYLTREFEVFSGTIDRSHSRVHSIYFGGGTPSCAPAGCIARLIEKIDAAWSLPDGVEISVEVNPRSAVLRTLKTYKAAGVNRLSIGVQSLQHDELKTLERLHGVPEAVQTIESARAAGFRNVGVDILFGIPGQTSASWITTLGEIAALKPEHISVYLLTLEQGTPLEKAVRAGRMTMPPEHTTALLYEQAHACLTASGYSHYEVSNYAREGFFSRHNTHYWRREPYRGFGLSAHSYYRAVRSWNTTDFDSYYRMIDGGILPVHGSEHLTQVQQMNESIMLGLRTDAGITMSGFKEKFGGQAALYLRKKCDTLINDPAARRYFADTRDAIRLNAAGFFVSDAIISRLFFDDERPPED